VCGPHPVHHRILPPPLAPASPHGPAVHIYGVATTFAPRAPRHGLGPLSCVGCARGLSDCNPLPPSPRGVNPLQAPRLAQHPMDDPPARVGQGPAPARTATLGTGQATVGLCRHCPPTRPRTLPRPLAASCRSCGRAGRGCVPPARVPSCAVEEPAIPLLPSWPTLLPAHSTSAPPAPPAPSLATTATHASSTTHALAFGRHRAGPAGAAAVPLV
jgi:hypothetical protein